MGRSRTGGVGGEGGKVVSAGRGGQAHAHHGDRATQGARGGGPKNRAGATETMHPPQPRYTPSDFFIPYGDSWHFFFGILPRLISQRKLSP